MVVVLKTTNVLPISLKFYKNCFILGTLYAFRYILLDENVCIMCANKIQNSLQKHLGTYLHIS